MTETPHDTPADRTKPGRAAATHLLLLLAVCSALFLLGSASLPLTDPDESRCAVIVRGMLNSGDWVVPHLDGEPYFDKPAPFFWLVAVVQQASGRVELGGRLVAALGGLACVLVTWTMGRRMFGPLAGLLAGLVLASSVQFLFMARWYRMDMPYAAAMWAALWWLWRAEQACPAPAWIAPDDPADVAPHAQPGMWSGWVGFYAFGAVATLFKGPSGLALPMMMAVLYLLLTRQFRRLVGLVHPLGIAVYLLIAAPWYVAISLREPGYAYEFFIRQNLQRYLGGTNLGHSSWPGVLYVGILLGGLLPWTIYLPGAVLRCLPHKGQPVAERRNLLLLWLVPVFTVTFFAFSHTRVLGYVLPAFAPLAILIGRLQATWASSRRPDRLLWHGASALMVCVCLLAAGLVAGEIYLGNLDAWIAGPLAFAAVALWRMGSCLKHARRKRFLAWGTGAIVMMLLFLGAHLAPTVYGRMSTRTLAQRVPVDLSGRVIGYAGVKKPSFLIYTGAAEFEEYEESSPQSIERLRRVLQSDRAFYCLITGREEFQKAQANVGPLFRIVAQQGERYLITNVGAGQGASTRPTSRPTGVPPASQTATTAVADALVDSLPRRPWPHPGHRPLSFHPGSGSWGRPPAVPMIIPVGTQVSAGTGVNYYIFSSTKE